MKISAQSRKQLRLANVSFVLLFLVAIGLLQWLSKDYHLKFDWTQGGRHSLSEASIATLKTLDKPVRITAFASQRQGRRKAISDLVSRYQRHKDDINLVFVDPDQEPERVREANIQFDGELRIEYGETRENLTKLNEEALTNALTRIGRSGERWLVFLEGHGERSPTRKANFDLSNWADQLRKRGFKARGLQLSENPQIPDNTTVLVIAGPQTRLLPGEVKAVRQYVDSGGNLLWLGDPGGLQGLEPLAETLGIEFESGTVVDPAAQLITGSATAVVVGAYNNHPVVKNFSTITLFPNATAVRLPHRNAGQDEAADGDWHAAALLDTRESAWVETGTLKGRVDFDKGKDVAGPVSLAATLSRQLKDKREQRVIITGDGDFLSNTYLGNGGNLELGLSMANWLSQDDAYVSIPVRTAPDKGLNLSNNAQDALALAFMILIPLGLLGGGITVWLRRRKR